MNQNAPQTRPPAQEFDVLMADFFAKEMPAPWPAFRQPGRNTVVPMSSVPAVASWTPSSRWALAASVALLLAGWLLSGSLGRVDPGKPNGMRLDGPGEASKLKGGHEAVPVPEKFEFEP